MDDISKNFKSQPASGGISSAMWQGGGGQSSMAYEPDGNAPVSKNAYTPSGNAPVSKNFVEASKAAKSASKIQGGKTHAAFRKGW
jgi:hypothetical protein